MRILFILLFAALSVFPQNKVTLNSLRSDFALKSERVKYKKELKSRIDRVLSGNLTSSAEGEWISLFKDISLAVWRDDVVLKGLTNGFENFGNRGIKFQRALLETAFAIYPDKFGSYISDIYHKTTDEMVFAYTVNILIAQKSEFSRGYFLADLEKRFPAYEKNDILRQLWYDLKYPPESLDKVLPPVQDIVSHEFEQNSTIIYSFHNTNREYPGITVIKGPDGNFVRSENDSLFYVQQMAVSVSNLPAYVKGGNTPQGIFSIVGWYVSPTDEIGPTPCVLTRIPFEKPPATFFHGNNKYKTWNIEDYKKLLPSSWKDYQPMYQSYYCGKNGRGLIVMHGSVDDLTFYQDKPYYPLTPTKGCLVTKELWDENSGKATESDQMKLYNAFISTGRTKGYLVVIDIISENRPVTPDDVISYIKQAEK